MGLARIIPRRAGIILRLFWLLGAFAGSSTLSGAPPGKTVKSDSAGAVLEQADSARMAIPNPDSLMSSLAGYQKPVKEKIKYSGESFVFFPRRNVVVIRGRATVESGASQVTADSILAYNRNTGDIFVRGAPELSEGAEKITGQSMHYNVIRDRGLVQGGTTTFDEWILTSDTLSKIGADSIFGKGCSFTTCELEQPHYHFESPKVKVIRGKRVFASPVVLKFGKVPVFVLPFVFFPITQGDRRSGLLQPRVGINSVMRSGTTGRTIGNLGYFWAPSDYLDLLGAVDIRTSSQTTLRSRTRYRKRYSFDGQFDGRVIFDRINESTAYSMFGRHNQTLGERARLIADVNYTSTRNLLRNTSFNRQDLLRQSLRSTGSYSWNPSWGSFNSSVRHEMFLQQENSRTQVTLPSLSLRLNQRNLFRTSGASARRQGLLSSAWIYNLTYGFSTDYSNTRTSGEQGPATTVQRSTSRFDLATPQTLHGWLKINPNLQYSTELVHDNSSATDKFSRGQFLNLSNSFSTQIFGFFDGPRIGPVFRWRHTVQPRLTYTFQPDLTPEKKGRKVNSLAFTVSNDIDYKYYQKAPDSSRVEADTSASGPAQAQPREKNGKLFSLRNSVNYDLIRAAKRDTLGWGDLSSSLTSSPSPFFNLQLSMNHQLVKRGAVERLRPFMNRLSTTVTLRGTYKAGEGGASLGELEEDAYLESLRYPNTIGSAFSGTGPGYEMSRDMAYSRAMPWSINLSHNLSRVRDGGRGSQSLRWSFTFNPTPGWHLIYSSSYNFSERGLQGQSFILTRELHRWQANLSLITLPGGRFEFTFTTFLKDNPTIRVPDVRRASN